MRGVPLGSYMPLRSPVFDEERERICDGIERARGGDSTAFPDIRRVLRANPPGVLLGTDQFDREPVTCLASLDEHLKSQVTEAMVKGIRARCQASGARPRASQARRRQLEDVYIHAFLKESPAVEVFTRAGMNALELPWGSVDPKEFLGALKKSPGRGLHSPVGAALSGFACQGLELGVETVLAMFGNRFDLCSFFAVEAMATGNGYLNLSRSISHWQNYVNPGLMPRA